MDAAEQEEVWNMLDRNQLAEIVRRGPSPVFASISGAHLYGFASPDSDVDVRGAFMRTTKELLGLRPPTETVTIEEKSPLDLDWVAHDLRKFARLMTNHNGYVLEQLFSPLVVMTTPLHEELQELGRGCVTRPTVRHYLGFYRGRQKRLSEPDPTVKHLLYAYRVLLTGIHLMGSGAVESNVITLNQEFGLEEIDDLIARKRSGAEKMPLGVDEVPHHHRVLARLEDQLKEAHEKSALPLEPTSVDALEDLVVRARLEADGYRPCSP